MYNPPLREFVGGMTDELGGSYITEYVSNGPKNYAYSTYDGKQVVNVKGFTLNCVASQQFTFAVMKEMAISELCGLSAVYLCRYERDGNFRTRITHYCN